MAEENDNEETIPQPKPFPPDLVEDLESKTVAHEVRDYLWGKGPVDYENVSAHMKRELVSRFVGFEMPDLPPQNFWRVRILADLYNLQEHLNFIQDLLKKQEAEPKELDRSIAGTIILDEIGDEAQKNFAAQYYEYLISHRFANEKFAELIECLAVLGNRVSPNPLRTRMEREIKTLSAREGGEPEAGVEKRYLEDLADNEFYFIEESNKSRQRISEIARVNERLLELIRVYLQLTEDPGTESFALWTQQQIRRIAETAGNDRVIEAFRFIIKSLREMKPDDEIFCKVRSYNAIEFFLGKLSEEEETVMKKYRKKQTDPLHYHPVPLHIDDPAEQEEEIEEEEDETENPDEI